MDVTFIGAAGTVTGSCSVVTIANTTILIDRGTAQGVPLPELPLDLSHLKAVVMTHGHLDHAGMIPELFDRGFRGPIYGHSAACEIAGVLWEDSARIRSDGREPPYDAATAALAKRSCRPQVYGTRFTVGDMHVTLQDAGHILGSSHVLIEHGETRVIFSGDIGVPRTPIIRDPFTAWDSTCSAVVIESTYGNRIHKDRNQTVSELRSLLLRTIEQRGVLLIPCFAIGRTQEMLFHFNDMVESGQIPRTPVIVDSPMASRVTAIYRAHEDCYDGPTRARILSGDLPFEFDGLSAALTGQQSREIAGMSPPLVVIAGSGMCNGGRIVGHLRRLLPTPSTTVAFVGYQAAGTLGRELVDGATQVRIDGSVVPVRASIATLGGFSAHADQSQLLDWARAVPGKGIVWFVNHGEPEASSAMAMALERNGLGSAHAVAPGESVRVG